MRRIARGLILLSVLSGCSLGQEPVARYCYKTLARIDCHAQPLPGQDYRLVGVIHESRAD